jgi:hypothetical protein
MSKGLSLGYCRTCGSEIVESFNDGVFGGGECEDCERLRYESHSALLDACRLALAYADRWGVEHERAPLRRALEHAIAAAEGRPLSP